jgi:hypothetical protein
MNFNSCIAKFIAKTPEELNRIFTNRRMTEDAGQFFTFNERIRIENVVCSIDSCQWKFLIKKKISDLS